jgi:glyoxylase-like metal-dependent hydrolase (beta-lactamase superfamily II)
MVLTGDALLVGDAGRPDLHAHGDLTAEQMARTLYRSLTERRSTPSSARWSGWSARRCR